MVTRRWLQTKTYGSISIGSLFILLKRYPIRLTMRKRKTNAIAKLEYQGLKIEVYNKHHLETVLTQLVEATKNVGQVSGDTNDGQEVVLPTVNQLVEAIEQLLDDMKHTHGDMMMKFLTRKLSSVGKDSRLYDRFVRLVCAAHRIIEEAQHGKFATETEELKENGLTKNITVFRFVKNS